MTTDNKRDLSKTLAITISVIFHPLFVPVYGLVIIFSASSLYGYLPYDVKKLIVLIILINNVLLPVSLLPFFRYRNIISSWIVETRRERIIPLITSTILYATTSIIIFRLPVPFLLKSFIFASFFIALSVTVINFWWKISIHSVGAGALTGFVAILSLKLNTQMSWYLIYVILASGMILSSRLKLNSHSPSQVWIGFLTGFLGVGLYMWFF